MIATPEEDIVPALLSIDGWGTTSVELLWAWAQVL